MTNPRPIVWFVLLTALPSPLSAQEQPKTSREQKALDLPDEDLAIMIKPLTKDQLETEAAGWLELLQTKVTEIAELQVELNKSADQSSDDRLTRWKKERNELCRRLDIVLEEWEAKGGETETYKRYIRSVSSISTELTDLSTLTSMLTDWLSSPTGGMQWGINLLLFLTTLLVSRIIANIAARVTARGVRTFKDTSDLLRDFFVNSVRRIVFFVGIVVALSFLKVDIGPFLAAIGALGFIIGFALQGTLSNFASGIMILLYQPYDIGNVVTVAGTTGKVDEMSLVSTTLKTPDNQTVVVPNSSIWGGIITNVTGSEIRRVDMTFGVGYDDDLNQVETILREVVGDHELVLADPEPLIRLHELADSSINFVCRPWSNTADYWSVYWDVTREVKRRFDAAGISIPYPQRDVHLHRVDG